ncbi:MAG: MBG domain-containing protein [Chitinophagaceae bacterium]
MKKLFLKVIFAGFLFLVAMQAHAQVVGTLGELIMPRYMYGNSASSSTHAMPYVFRASVSGLIPNTLYGYTIKSVFTTDARTASAGSSSGITLGTSDTGAFKYFAGTTVLSSNPQFTTDANGSFTGWFVHCANNSTKFAPGNQVQIMMVVGIPSGGTSTYTYYYGNSIIEVRNWTADAAGLTLLRSTPASDALAKQFIMLYDTETPTAGERPVAGAFVESDGLNESSLAVKMSAEYLNNVDNVDKAWGSYIPNNLPNGLRRIVRYKYTGEEAGRNVSADGNWPGLSGTVSTVNATGGESSVIVIDGAVATLAAPPKSDPHLDFPTAFPAEVYTNTGDFLAGVTSQSPVTITYTSSNTNVAMIDATGLIHVVGAGTTDIAAIQATNNDYLADTAIRTLLVSPPKATPALAFPASFPGTVTLSTANFNAGVTSDAPAPITYSSSNTTVATIDASGLIHIVGVGTTDITAFQAADASYTEATATQTLTVVDKPVPAITFIPFSAKIYGDASFSLSASASSGVSPVFTSNNPSVAQIVNGQVTITGAGSAVITAFFPATGDYSQASAYQTLTVQKKNLTIVADNKTKIQGQNNPLLTATYIGFVNGDTNTTGLQVQPQLTTNAITDSPFGIYTISASGAASNNYVLSYVSGTLTVNPVILDNTITFNTIGQKVYGQADFSSGATVTSGLKLELTSSNTSVAVISGTSIHVTGTGTTVITANQPGDATHPAATPVSQTLTVNKALLTITPASISKKQGEANPVLALGYAGFVYNENATVLTASPVATTVVTSSTPAGVYTITASGAAAVNYDIAYMPGTFTILPGVADNQEDLTAYCDAKGQLKVSMLLNNAGKVTIQLYDAGGKQVVNLPVTVAKGYNVFHVDVSSLAPGVYPLRVAGGDVHMKAKVVIR